jgi:3-hydroxyisobutyrate dehydrogenase-like beta-hydroxyacid dehydrogenase
MCKNLAEKGNLKNPLIVFNRTAKRATDLASALGSQVQVAESIEDTAKRASMIFICLGDDAAVSETIEKILQQDVTGKLIVDCSTVAPDTTNGLATKINAKGAEFVACPGEALRAAWHLM